MAPSAPFHLASNAFLPNSYLSCRSACSLSAPASQTATCPPTPFHPCSPKPWDTRAGHFGFLKCSTLAPTTGGFVLPHAFLTLHHLIVHMFIFVFKFYMDRIWDRIERFMSKDSNTKKNGRIDHAAIWQTLHQFIFRHWAGEALLQKLGLGAHSAEE